MDFGGHSQSSAAFAGTIPSTWPRNSGTRIRRSEFLDYKAALKRERPPAAASGGLDRSDLPPQLPSKALGDDSAAQPFPYGLSREFVAPPAPALGPRKVARTIRAMSENVK